MKEYKGVINISWPTNDFYIYKMYSSNKEDKSIYIGVSEEPKQRFKGHSANRFYERANKDLYQWMIQTIDVDGYNVIFEVIEGPYSEIEAYKKEIAIIKEYRDSSNYKVLNKADGGKGYTGVVPWNKGKRLSKDLRDKLSKAHIGKPSNRKGKTHTLETKTKISQKNKQRIKKGWKNPRKKKIYKYDLNKNLLRSFPSAEEAAIHENTNKTSISEWCRGEKKPRNKNFIWSYLILNKEDFIHNQN
jgi:hypothetical protein